MSREAVALKISSSTAPTIEVDPEADAIYIRFSSARVARTLEVPSKNMHIAVDLGSKDQVVGIEAIGASGVAFEKIARSAKVDATSVDFGRARIAIPA